MTTLGERLEQIQKKAKLREDPSLTSDEIKRIISALTLNATTAAERGDDHASLLLDKFPRDTEKHKLAVPRRAIPAVEKHFEEQKMRATFRDDPNVSCGMCNMADCDKDVHFGYFVTWEQKKQRMNAVFAFAFLCFAAAEVVEDSPYFYGNTNLPPSPTFISCLDAARNTTAPIDNTTTRCDFGVSCRCGLCSKVTNSSTPPTAQFCVVRHESGTDGFDCAPFSEADDSACEETRTEARTEIALAAVAYFAIGTPLVACFVYWAWKRHQRRQHQQLA